YFSIIRDICDRYDVLLILDEVMCGMGRTGRWFACEHQDVIPDIITLGKGLSGGTLALSAVGVTSNLFDLVRKNNGAFMHGGTFSHHSVAAAAGLTVIHILERENLVERVARYGKVLGDTLKDRVGSLPWVADVRGIGFLWGIELVRNRETNQPFDRKEQVTERIWEAMFQKGVIVYKSTGLAGTHGDALIVAPPFIITEDEIRMVADTLRDAILEILGS
ncbi:MAG: aspartate aminotransferase family protein, partial [Deltaproteobacteria bacterium]|nr:aspartate aminotransferase family protein [Deltaproteobacteria bacterium]